MKKNTTVSGTEVVLMLSSDTGGVSSSNTRLQSFLLTRKHSLNKIALNYFCDFLIKSYYSNF